MNEETVNQIIEDWSTGQDVWHGDMTWMGESFEDAFIYPPTSLLLGPDKPTATTTPFRPPPPKPDFRPLPDHYADEARKYIAVICQRYPVQLRVLMGLPMWLRFCDVWNETGKKRTAMRVI